MEKYLVRVLNDTEMDQVVGGSDAKSVAVTAGAGVTCVSSVLAVGCFIAALVSNNGKVWKAAASFGSIAVAGAISTGAISKIK